ncbi:MAG: hypothetical protein ACT6RD_11745 [Brevundimonas sp.]|uniref:hypothetical protein n=1 Tax=Brevundimonas sp. TaxID=1871086 RepID=UPI0040345276
MRAIEQAFLSSKMLIAVGLAAMALVQTPPSPPECRISQTDEACARARRAAFEARQGLTSIEAEAGTGAEIYRAGFTHGFGGDMPTIAFERRPGESPRVVVYLSPDKQMKAPVPLSDWEAVRRAARFADRELAPDMGSIYPPGMTPPHKVCLHAWSTWIEMANTTTPEGRDVPVRRRGESACGGELTATFAFDLAARAVSLLPDCVLLDRKREPSDVIRLALCGNLDGDRMAAAGLMNQIGVGHADPGQRTTRERAWSAWMGTNADAVLTWPGDERRYRQTGMLRSIGAFLAEKEAEERGFRVNLMKFSGVSGTRVEVSGRIETDSVDGEGRVNGGFFAPFTQVWGWDRAWQEWRLEGWTVEPFQPRT